MIKWNRDNVLRWILDRDSQGLPVTAKAAREANCYMYRSATISFGSWACALSAAGIHVAGSSRRWSCKRIIASIRRLGRRSEHLRYSWVFRCRRGLYEACRTHFGSWRQALIAADIDPQSVQAGHRWDREAIVEAILERALKRQPLAKARVPSGLRAAAASTYGSWREAISAAGLKPDLYLGSESQGHVAPSVANREPRRPGRPSCRQKWTRDTIAQALRERVMNSKPVHPSRLKAEVRNLHQAIKHCFGNWASAMAFAGLDPGKFTKDRRWSARTEPPHAEDGEGEHAPRDGPEAETTDNTAEAKPDMQRRAHRRTKWTREAIIGAIQARAARGLPLKKWMVQPHHLGQVAAVVFGSWESALRVAEVDINEQPPEANQAAQASPSPSDVGADADRSRAGPPWTREAIFEVIRRRADAQQPLNEAIIRVECGGMYGAAKAKFGSWAETLIAFGLDPDDVRKGPARANRLCQIE